jgi:DNA repair protein RadC
MTSKKKYENPAGHRKRLRGRFLKAGRNALADYELLELLLTYAIPRRNTKPMAKALLDRFGNFISVLQQPEDRLLKVHDIGPTTVTFLHVVRACLTRCMESSVESRQSLGGPEDVFAFIRLHLGALDKECIYILYLDDAKRLVHHAEISVGTVDRVTFYLREIFKPAMIYNATGLVLVHNHPHGEPVPSDQDFEITRKLEETAVLLNITLVDHIIINPLQGYSIKTGNLL